MLTNMYEYVHLYYKSETKKEEEIMPKKLEQRMCYYAEGKETKRL